MKNFSKKLMELSTKYNIEYMINYSQKLIENIDSFEIASISTMLDEFENIIKYLKSKV